MKTSTKIFLGAILLLGISLAFYDRRLAAEFRKGDYTDPYYNYTKLNYRGFDEIDLRSGSSFSVMVTQGDYKVLVHPQASGFAIVRQEGKRLIIEAHFPDHFRGVNAAHTIYVACPALSVFRADAKYTVGSETLTDYANWDFQWFPTMIRGFKQDSLTILEDHASNLVLESDRIGRLTAVVGMGGAVSGVRSDGAGRPSPVEPMKKDESGAAVRESGAGGERESTLSGPVLTIGQGNHFDSSDLNILYQGQLRIKGTDIRQLTFHLADSAILTVNGLAARYLNLH
jgi:hypothetical protein